MRNGGVETSASCRSISSRGTESSTRPPSRWIFGGNWPAAKELYGSRLPADIVAFGDRFVERSGEILEGLMGPDTLVHSDFRADNLSELHAHSVESVE